jgi:hypothetical protein
MSHTFQKHGSGSKRYIRKIMITCHPLQIEINLDVATTTNHSKKKICYNVRSRDNTLSSQLECECWIKKFSISAHSELKDTGPYNSTNRVNSLHTTEKC